MAKDNATQKLGNPLDRSGRLHAGCILDHGARSLFGESLEAVCAMPSSERWQRIPKEPDDRFSAQAIEVIQRTISEIDAWLVVQRIRITSRS